MNCYNLLKKKIGTDHCNFFFPNHCNLYIISKQPYVEIAFDPAFLFWGVYPKTAEGAEHKNKYGHACYSIVCSGKELEYPTIEVMDKLQCIQKPWPIMHL